MTTSFATVGDAVPGLNNLSAQLQAAPSASSASTLPPPSASPVSAANPASTGSGGPPPPSPGDGGNGGNNNDRRGMFLPRWLARLFIFILAWSMIHGVIYYQNSNGVFELSNSLDHQGPWYRQAALAPVDCFITRTFEVRKDIWGRPYAIYRVGSRKFVQTQSNEPAVEILE